MASRSTFSLLSAAFLLTSTAVFSTTAFAQSGAPAGVEQALRARASEFFQDFIDGKFRQAINLVAEDTQDEYFNSPKAEIKAFKIDSIDYSDGFTKAVVRMTVTQAWKLKAEGFIQDQQVDAPMATTWKIEDGKWMFYNRRQTSGNLTPMGLSADIKPDANASAPKKFDNDTMAQEAKRILNQSTTATGLSQNQVTFAMDKPSSVKIKFHNGAAGSISISLVGMPNVLAGFSAKLDKQTVNANEDAFVDVSFTPPAEQTTVPPLGFEMAVAVEPFGQGFPIEVNFVQVTQ